MSNAQNDTILEMLFETYEDQLEIIKQFERLKDEPNRKRPALESKS